MKMAEIGKVELLWDSNLLKNQSYINNDMKLGHTPECQKAMWDIVMLLRSQLYGWNWNGERIQVLIRAYRPRTNIDAQNLIASVSDAIESAIHVDDKHYDVAAVGIDDYEGEPRIEIELSQ
jgi:hypothetical protein